MFPYTDITGIEYNAGLMNGVLEILTPSYDGTANKDYWKFWNAETNAEGNSPYALSNTLPLPKHVYQRALRPLNELRKRIADNKRPKL